MEKEFHSFGDDVWRKLLKPLPTYDTRSKYESCFRYWCGLDEDKRNRVYHIIEERKKKGLFVNPNPRFALDDAAQQDEIERAKARAKPKKEPTNLNGCIRIDTLIKTVPLVSAIYNGRPGIYTFEEAKEYGMDIKYGMNFKYQPQNENENGNQN